MLRQHVDAATYDAGNIFDLSRVIDGSQPLSNVVTQDVFLADPRFVSADVAVDRPRSAARTMRYRNVKIVDPAVFGARLHETVDTDVGSPADVDEFTERLDRSVTVFLDEFAPVISHRPTVRPGR
jgi:hypothetical protein